MSHHAHKTFTSIFFDTLHKAKDGRLTLEEISEIMRDISPEHFTDVYEEVKKAEADGHISWGEVLKIVSAVMF